MEIYRSYFERRRWNEKTYYRNRIERKESERKAKDEKLDWMKGRLKVWKDGEIWNTARDRERSDRN